MPVLNVQYWVVKKKWSGDWRVSYASENTRRASVHERLPPGELWGCYLLA